MKLFDIRTDNSKNHFIEAVNQWHEDDPGIPYFSQFGLVGSARWWECFNRGALAVTVFSGKVSYCGPRTDEFNETEDVVEFVCSRQTFAYNRTGHWDVPSRVGDRMSVTQTIVVLLTRTGPVECHIDLWAEWQPGYDELEGVRSASTE